MYVCIHDLTLRVGVLPFNLVISARGLFINVMYVLYTLTCYIHNYIHPLIHWPLLKKNHKKSGVIKQLTSKGRDIRGGWRLLCLKDRIGLDFFFLTLDPCPTHHSLTRVILSHCSTSSRVWIEYPPQSLPPTSLLTFFKLRSKKEKTGVPPRCPNLHSLGP